MKKTNVLYWVFTGLFCAFMLTSTIPNIMVTEDWVTIFQQLGYPQYMIRFIGVAKLMGVIGILVPGFPRLKEWAYAGLFFDLLGATYSSLAVSGFMLPMLVMLIPFGFGGLSYIYHHKRLKEQA
jgi:hypothetical protein